MYKITSRYLDKENFRSIGHSGVDFAMENGTPLRSIQNGIVEKVVDYQNTNAGKCIKIKFEDGNTAIYGHLSEFSVKEGQTVHAGDLIGLSGNSGHVVGSNGGYHLHFGVKDPNGNFIDPSPYINDIQHMNEVGYFANNIAQQATEVKLSFFNYFQQHMDLLPNIKMNLIHFFTLTDYSPLIKVLQHIVQFIFFYS